MTDSKIQCDVCRIHFSNLEWESHINTKEHKENSLTQIMESRIGKEITPDVRDETTEILEELEMKYDDESIDT
jgi:hypothetical protein